MTARSEAAPGWERETSEAQRFRFGDNWASFLKLLDSDRIQAAEESLKAMLDVKHLEGRSFLDIGSGSGLFSLAARRLGANVVSFDYDPQSVACTAELRRRFFPGDNCWRVETGSVLDKDFLASLGTFDVVYSWGVLHHTGSMWEAMELASGTVAPGGSLFIAIYNDQGPVSLTWRRVKSAYLRASPPFKWLIFGLSLVVLWGPPAARRLMSGKRPGVSTIVPRGMNRWHDAKDWIGGYPFEVARPEEVFDFYRSRGFQLVRLRTCAGRIGCNEYVFVCSHR